MEETQPNIAPNTTTPSPTMQTVSETVAEPRHQLLGIIIGSGVVLLVLILGGFYLWGSMLSEQSMTNENMMGQHNAEQNTTPDEFSDIENDLKDELGDAENDLKEIDEVFGPEV